jgi:hypothetical protein
MLLLSIITITGLLSFMKFPEKLFPQVPVSRTIPTSEQIPAFTPSPSFEQMPALTPSPFFEQMLVAEPIPGPPKKSQHPIQFQHLNKFQLLN